MANYEHLDEARAVASSISNIRDLVSDDVPDQAQIIQYLAEISAVVTPIQAVLKAEELSKFRVKFAAEVALIVIRREAAKLDAGALRDNLLELVATGQRLLEINLPDEV